MKQKPFIDRVLNIKVVLFVFLIISLIYIDKPGLYMDAVNPDYMGLHIYQSDNVSVWAYSDNVIATKLEHSSEYSHFPVLNSLYGTCFEMYTMMLWAKLFGFGEVSLRTSHILYAVLLLVGVYCLLKYLLDSPKKAALGTLLLAIEPSLVFSTRTQYYIQLYPYLFFSFGLICVLSSMYDDARTRKIFGGFVLLGLSACSYFVFAFYAAAIFMIFFAIQVRKKDLPGRKGLTAVSGFLLGFFPFLYGHLSIILTQGSQRWIEWLKGLDVYGISEGASATLFGRIRHIRQSIGDIIGGESILSIMTGYNARGLYGNFFAGLYFLAVVVAVFVLVKNKDKLLTSKSFGALAILINILLWHVLLGLIVGNSLGYQHFVMLMPVMYLTIYLVIMQFVGRQGAVHYLLVGLVGFVVLSSAGSIVNGYELIVETGGVKYYSDAIDDMGYYLNSAVTDNDTIMAPQWGYWMQIACITNGEKQIWNDTDESTLQWKMDNRQKTGKYYVIVDNITDQALVDGLMEKNGYTLEYTAQFYDYGQILEPEIRTYAQTDPLTGGAEG